MTYEVRQEVDRVNRRFLLSVGLSSLVIIAVSLAVAALLLGWVGAGRDHGPAVASAAPSQIGTVEQTLVLDTERGIALRRDQRDALARWAWVDRDAGIARIPVERAMDLLAAHPLPLDRAIEPTAPTTTAMPSSLPLPAEVGSGLRPGTPRGSVNLPAEGERRREPDQGVLVSPPAPALPQPPENLDVRLPPVLAPAAPSSPLPSGSGTSRPSGKER